MAVAAEAELDEVDPQRRAAHPLQQLLITRGRRFDVVRVDRHREQLPLRQRTVAHQDPGETREVAARVTARRDAFVHLRDVNPVPRQVEPAQLLEHAPRGLATAHGDERAAARRHRLAAGGRDLFRRGPGGRGGVCRGDQMHRTSPFGGGSYQPP